MDVRVDLHLHTTASDGRWTPEQLVAEVQQAGIGLFAVTDHDSLGSLADTAERVRGTGLRLLTGVELSTRLNGQAYHLLGYGFDPTDAALKAFVEANNALLAGNNDKAIHLLQSAGYPISWDDYVAYTWDRRRGGWKSLNFLIDRGFCTGPRDFFSNLVSPYPVERPSFPHPTKAIAAIREASGVPILAHPGASLDHTAVTEEALSPFLDYGIAGLECYSCYHNEATTRFCLDWCARHDLLVTGGSDCHGGLVGRELGVPAVDVADLRLGELDSWLASP